MLIHFILFLDLNDLIRLHVILLELLLFRHTELVEASSGVTFDWTARCRDFQTSLSNDRSLLDQNLISLGNLDLCVLQRQRNAIARLALLQNFTLLRLVEVVVDVVCQCALQMIHLADDLMVLL